MTNQNQGNDNSMPRNWLSDALIIAGIPALGYLFAFAYEYGFAQELGIPMEFISVELSSVFFSSGSILLLALGILSVSGLIHRSLATHPNMIYRFVHKYWFPVAYLGAIVLIYRNHWSIWIWGVIGLISVAVIFDILLPLTHTEKGTFREKYEAELAESRDREMQTYLGLFLDRIGLTLFKIFGLAFMGFYLAYSLGNVTAMDKETFLVPESAPDFVVLRVYGDTFFMAKFDAETKLLEKKFKIFKTGQGTELTFVEKKIGPLVSE